MRISLNMLASFGLRWWQHIGV